MKNINFSFTSEYGYNIEAARPKPATEFIPNWFKDMPQYDHADGIRIVDGVSNATVKKCTPMLDSIISGYILSLWTDVIVKRVSGFPEISWKSQSSVFSLHGPSSRHMPSPPGYEQIVFKYNSMLTAKTPKEYSLFVSSPSGHYGLPFLAISAIIDSDVRTIDLQFPMWIKKDFEGIVEKGTPLIQVTPFKRESWKADFDYMNDLDFSVHMDNNFNSKIKNHYVKNIWSKKVYK
jgi:hypothetical protein